MVGCKRDSAVGETQQNLEIIWYLLPLLAWVLAPSLGSKVNKIFKRNCPSELLPFDSDVHTYTLTFVNGIQIPQTYENNTWLTRAVGFSDVFNGAHMGISST